MSKAGVEAEQAYAPGRLAGRIRAADRPAPAWPAVPMTASRTYARPAAFSLGGLIVISIVVRALLARGIETPWIMVDELIYSELAKSFAEHGHFLLRDVPYGGVGKVYPALISPAWLADSMTTTYGIAKTLNAVIMSLVAVPTYLWARRLVSPVLSLVAAGLVLLLPAFVYTGNLMTENAFLPAFVLAAFATALALERPTIATQAFALGAAALATVVRVQGVVLFAVIVLAVGTKVLLDLRVRSGRPWALIRPYVPMLVVTAAGGLGYVVLKKAQGADLSSGLGAYDVVAGANYSVQDSARWVSYHFAELSLALGIVPFAALVVLAALAVARGLPGAAERAFVAVAVSAVLLVVVQVGLFASRFAFRIEERNMLVLGPILLVGFVLWIGRGIPRPPVIATVAALGSAALLLIIPLPSLLNWGALSDTIGLIPVLRLSRLVFGGIDESRWIMVLGAVNAALAFLVLPRRAATVGLPVLLGAYLVLATNLVFKEVSAYSGRVKALTGGSPTWIDDRVGTNADVVYLRGAGIDPLSEAGRLWQLEFWNRSLGGIYNLGGPGPVSIAQIPVSVDRTGHVTADSPEIERASYVVATDGVKVLERPVAEQGGLVLYAVRQPLRVESDVRGGYGDGSFGSIATYDRYASPGGRAGILSVQVSRKVWKGPDKPGHVVVSVGPLGRGPDGTPRPRTVTATRTWTVHSGGSRTLALPTPPPPFAATIAITPTFSPADYGLPDTRQIGAWLSFEFEPFLSRS